MTASDDTPTKWCPTCQKYFTTTRESCPVCLADLFDSLTSGPSHGALDNSIDDPMIRLLISGNPLPRPDSLPAFRDGPRVTLTRFGKDGVLLITGHDSL